MTAQVRFSFPRELGLGFRENESRIPPQLLATERKNKKSLPTTPFEQASEEKTFRREMLWWGFLLVQPYSRPRSQLASASNHATVFQSGKSLRFIWLTKTRRLTWAIITLEASRVVALLSPQKAKNGRLFGFARKNFLSEFHHKLLTVAVRSAQGCQDAGVYPLKTAQSGERRGKEGDVREGGIFAQLWAKVRWQPTRFGTKDYTGYRIQEEAWSSWEGPFDYFLSDVQLCSFLPNKADSESKRRKAEGGEEETLGRECTLPSLQKGWRSRNGGSQKLDPPGRAGTLAFTSGLLPGMARKDEEERRRRKRRKSGNWRDRGPNRVELGVPPGDAVMGIELVGPRPTPGWRHLCAKLERLSAGPERWAFDGRAGQKGEKTKMAK